jgi:hypothetical protein
MSEKGEWIKGSRSDTFLSSLVVDDSVLEPGRYVVMVGPNWNEEANQSEEHKQIFFEALSSAKIRFKLLEPEYGYSVLHNALTGLALGQPESERKYYKEN